MCIYIYPECRLVKGNGTYIYTHTYLYIYTNSSFPIFLSLCSYKDLCCSSVLQCVAVSCSVLQCLAVSFSVLQCVATPVKTYMHSDPPSNSNS